MTITKKETEKAHEAADTLDARLAALKKAVNYLLKRVGAPDATHLTPVAEK